MKRLTQRHQSWLAARQRSEQKKRRLRGRQRAVVLHSQYGNILVRVPFRVRSLPTRMCLIENTSEVVDFLDSLRSRFANPGRQRRFPQRGGRKKVIGSYFDFSTIRYIAPSAALVLAAEYDRMQIRMQERTSREIDKLSLIDVRSWDPTVLRTLHELGFFKLLQIDHAPPPEGCGTLRILEFASGTKVDSEVVGKLNSQFLKLLSDLGLAAGIKITDFYGPVIEAVENVHLHAYPPDATYRFRPVHKWWLTAAVDMESESLHVVVFDQGISIPASLPHSPIATEVLRWLNDTFGGEFRGDDPRYDSEAIKAAMKVGSSSTYLNYRGKGLGHMRELIEGKYQGELCIMSRNGLYRIKTGEDAEVSKLNCPIGGTLIEWKIRTQAE